jgi:hypothetical protein
MADYEPVPDEATAEASTGKATEINDDWQKDEKMWKTTKWGGIVTFVDGHVDGYSLERVLRLGFFRIKAPVFSDSFVKMQTLFVVLMVFLTASSMIALHKSGIMLIGGALVGISASIFDYYGGLSGFLFGFFVFDNLGTFVNLKNNQLGGFWGAFQDVMTLLGAWFPETDDKTKLLKFTIVRWGLAALALMAGTAGGDMSEAENIADAQRRKLLTAEEAAQVTTLGGMPIAPLVWMFNVLESNLKDKRGGDIKINKIEDKIINMRGGIGGVLVSTSSFGLTPFPLVHMMSALVKIQLLFLGIKEGINIADIICGETTGKGPQVAFSLLMAIATPLIFQGLLEFVIMIRNPFGSDWVDFPMRLFHQQIRDEMFQFAQAGELAPGIAAIAALPPL